MPRRLRPDEEALWRRVASHATPLHPDRPKRKAPAPIPNSPPPVRTTPLTAFRIGESAQPTTPGAELRQRPAALNIDRRTHKALSRGKRTPDATIDLHGMTLAQAHPALTRFVLASYATGRRLVLVVTGKGRGGAAWESEKGVLRRQVPDWLTGAPLGNVVQEILPAHRSHGGSGAYYVVLRRN